MRFRTLPTKLLCNCADSGDSLSEALTKQNTARVRAQRKAPLRIIIGNPPYSVGQKSANDNAQNQSYPNLERRVEQTYAAASNATRKSELYDSYIKAFRWSTDRLDPQGGSIAFVSNGAWLDGNTMAGFRNTLQVERPLYLRFPHPGRTLPRARTRNRLAVACPEFPVDLLDVGGGRW